MFISLLICNSLSAYTPSTTCPSNTNSYNSLSDNYCNGLKEGSTVKNTINDGDNLQLSITHRYRCCRQGVAGDITISTDIPAEAFYVSTKIKNVALTSGVTSIGEYAFYGCTNLVLDLSFDSKLSSISENAFESGNYKISNRALNVYMKQYKFLYVFQEFSEDTNQNIFENFKESNITIINFFDENDADIYMISFKHTVIVIKKTDLFLLNSLFLQNTKSKICFLTSKGRDFFKSAIKILNNEIEFTEENEFINMKQEFKISNYKYNNIWLKISECIIKYLIKQSYLKLNVDRIDNFFKNSEKNSPNKNLNKNDFIHVKDIGVGSSSNAFLYFHLVREEFFVMKMFNHYDTENLNLIQREVENYEKIMNHPFLPKFYGNDKENSFLVIEYIDGNILTNVKNLKNSEKVTIIFELMLIIEYCHRKKLILRDLKPDNIIIDKNKTVVLIDFNRTIKFTEKDNPISIDLNSIYAADELCHDINEYGCSYEYSYECDICSLGKIIYFIMKEEEPKNENLRKKIFFGNEYSKIADIVINCIKKEPKERPLIVDLIIDFYITYHSDIKIQNLHKIFDMNEILKINDFWENPEKVT